MQIAGITRIKSRQTIGRTLVEQHFAATEAVPIRQVTAAIRAASVLEVWPQFISRSVNSLKSSVELW